MRTTSMTALHRSRGHLLVAVLVTTVLASACGGSSTPTEDATTTPTDTTASSEVENTTGQSLGEPEQPGELETLTSTFTKLTEPGVGGRITSLAFDPVNPERLYVGGDMLGIAVTDDFGDTWESTTGLASWEIGDITTSASSDGRIWTGSLSGRADAANPRIWRPPVLFPHV